MVYRRRTRKRRRRKYLRKPSFKRRRATFRRKRSVSSRNFVDIRAAGKNCVPLTLRCKMPYVDHFIFDNAVTTNGYQKWRINSMFDPDITNVGHQPRGFDQMSALYQRYMVNKFTMTCKVSNYGTSPLIVGYYFYDVTATALSIPSDYLDLERPGLFWKRLNAGPGDSATVAVTKPPTTTLKMTINPSKYFTKNNRRERDNDAAHISMNPLNLYELTIFFFTTIDPIQSVIPAALKCDFFTQITFDATFSDRKHPVSS